MPRSSIPSLVALLVLSSALARSQVVAYHDVSSTTHQTNTTSLRAQGYRITSLSVAGGLSAPRYSAVWEQLIGTAWVTAHDLSLTDYTNTRALWIGLGYRAKLITAAGSGSDTVFAAVFVADGAVVADFSNYTEASLISSMSTQRDAGRIPVSVDIHGTAANPRYCAVFEPNTAGKVWGYDIDANSADFTDTRVAHFEGGERPACLGMSDSQRYVSVWYDDRVDNWACLPNHTSSGWQTVFNTWTGNGYYPRLIASGGSGSSLRFAGSFAERRTPLPRVLTVTGTQRSEFAALDDYMTNLVQNRNARAASMAIARNGRLVWARAYTWAEPGYPITQPTDAFRIASCTKPVTAIATHQADEQGYLSMSTRPQAVLGLPYADSRFDDIEIRHILEHTSALDRNYDPVSVATWASSPLVLPSNLADGVAWLAQQPMMPATATVPVAPAPGAYYDYSNRSWMLPAEVIRVSTGQSFMAYLQSQVLTPLGITRIVVAPSEFSQITGSDALHHLTWLRLSPSELYTDRRRKSWQYAEDLNFKRASGGLASSTVDYVRLLAGVYDLRGADAIVLSEATRTAVLDRHAYPLYDDPSEDQGICLAAMPWVERPNGVYAYRKSGGLENASAYTSWRSDGISWAIFVNTADAGPNPDAIDSRIEAITSWPNVDEFPAYGLPAFPQRPRIDSVSPSSLPNLTTTSSFLLTGLRLDTVTRIDLGSHQITSQSPSAWEDGYFTILSPTQVRVSPPQGMAPQGAWLWAINPVGSSNPVSVSLTQQLTFRLGAPSVVNAGQQWSAYVSRGTVSGLSTSTLAMLCLSFSNQPSQVPGFVDLGIGNQFADLLTTGAVPFELNSNLAHFPLPPLPGGTIWLQAVALDFGSPSFWPLPASNFLSVTRQ